MNDELLPWRLYKKLTIGEAAWLLCGVDPNSDPNLERPPQYVVWIDHIQRAINKGELFETMRVEGSGGITGGVILVKDLLDWLKGQGVVTGFFFDLPGGIEAQPPVRAKRQGEEPKNPRKGAVTRLTHSIIRAMADLEKEVKRGKRKKVTGDDIFDHLRNDDPLQSIVEWGKDEAGEPTLTWEDTVGLLHTVKKKTIMTKISEIRRESKR